MPIVVLVIVAVAAGSLAALITWRYPRLSRRGMSLSIAAAERAGEAAGRHPRWRSTLARRLDPDTATGLALSLALLVTVAGGLLLAVLAYLVRGHSDLVQLDDSVARWADRHATGLSTDALQLVTDLGEPTVVAAMAAILAVVETLRTRSRWVAPFLLVVVAGNGLATTAIKGLADRVRPTLNPVAETLGPSFPSGHSSWSAAFFAAAALLVSRQRRRPARALIAGAGVGLAAAVASSRALLGVHWLSDVLAGLSLGWAWFAACSVGFGGRLLRFGAAAEEATRAAETAATPNRDPTGPWPS
jgi:membrane-associated phospholipid phosphatase